MRELIDYRSEFPILGQTTYLINHSLAAMPARAEERLAEYARMWKERGIRAWGEGWWQMPIRSHLRLLVAAGLSGLLIFAAVAFTALIQIEVNGPIYRRISLSQNVVSDYVPPPESLLQAALICNMMENASDPAQLQRYVYQFQVAQHSFETKFADYMRRMPEGTLKDLMRGTAYMSAEEYF